MPLSNDRFRDVEGRHAGYTRAAETLDHGNIEFAATSFHVVDESAPPQRKDAAQAYHLDTADEFLLAAARKASSYHRHLVTTLSQVQCALPHPDVAAGGRGISPVARH